VTAYPATAAAGRGTPSANAGARRFAVIVFTLAKNEFKVRYFGSVLGYLWSLMRPLMLFGVLYVVFTHVVRFGGDIEHYPLKLLLAIVIWSYFAEVTGQGVNSLVQRENLLRRVPFPPAAIPLSVVLTGAFNFALNLCVMLGFVLVTGIGPAVSWLELLPLVALLVVLAAAVSTLLAVLYVPFRDMAPIWEVATQMLFWGTPIIYTIESVPDGFREALMFNPLAVAIQQGRHWLVESSTQSAADAIGGAVLLLVPFAIFGLIVAASWAMFRREGPRIAEDL
jgi:ABC-2 type transport system permease protein